MPILNYTTTIAPEKTAADITGMLARKGARSVSTIYDPAGDLSGIAFTMVVAGVMVNFALPANVDGVRGYMEKETKGMISRDRKAKIAIQAKKTAWRILKDWCEAQLALVESQQAEMGQVFMPYATQRDGRTMYQLFVENNQRQLESGGSDGN